MIQRRPEQASKTKSDVPRYGWCWGRWSDPSSSSWKSDDDDDFLFSVCLVRSDQPIGMSGSHSSSSASYSPPRQPPPRRKKAVSLATHGHMGTWIELKVCTSYWLHCTASLILLHSIRDPPDPLPPSPITVTTPPLYYFIVLLFFLFEYEKFYYSSPRNGRK